MTTKFKTSEIPFIVPAPIAEVIPLQELIKATPDMIESIIKVILMDFDYEANLSANTAIAVRALATLAVRLTAALENADKGAVH